MTSFSRRLAAVIAAGSLTFGATCVGMPAVSAQVGTETPQAPAPAAPAGTIDPAKTATLNIYKKQGDPTAMPGAADLPGLAGVSFKVEKLKIDLTTQAGWTELAGITAADIGDDKIDPEKTETVTTNEKGLATYEGTAGVFRVTEIQKQGFSVAPPFLVALPHSNSDGTWNYTQDVYPKNQNIQPNKQVDDTGATLGNNLKYTINAPVPAGTLTTQFAIEDKLAPNLTLVTNPPISVTTTGTNSVTLEKDTDYTLTTDTTAVPNSVKVTFTKDGIANLQRARQTDPSLQVSVAFSAQVSSLPDKEKTVKNTATIYLPNGGKTNTDDTVEGKVTPASTDFADLVITKIGTVGEMAGAEFQLYECQKVSETKWQLLGSPITVSRTNAPSPQNTLLTEAGDDGDVDTAQGFGIPTQSYSTGGTGLKTNTYCVMETKAPAGYVRNPEPRPVNLANGVLTAEVTNQKDSILGQLPATGAWGIVLVFLFGLLLLARGLYTSYKDNKASN